MITIKNKLLMSQAFWDSFNEVMKSKKFNLTKRMDLAKIKRNLSVKLEDLRVAMEALDNAENFKLMNLSSQIESEVVVFSMEDMEDMTAEDIYSLSDIITLEG